MRSVDSPLAAIAVASLALVFFTGCKNERVTDGQPMASSISELSWMMGTWRTEQDGRRSEEYWSRSNDSTLIGLGRTFQDEHQVFIEYLAIEERPDDLVYMASPNGRVPPTEFRLVESGPTKAVFANPNHDFPQRLIYERDGDTMHARIEGKENGKNRYEEWTWKLVR